MKENELDVIPKIKNVVKIIITYRFIIWLEGECLLDLLVIRSNGTQSTLCCYSCDDL
mgnify:CR=1 FL=1